MTTVASFSFDEPVGTTWHDQSGFLNNLTNAGGTSGAGKWNPAGPFGGIVTTSGGATGTMTSGVPYGVSEWNDALASDTGSVGMWVKANSGASGTMVLFHANTVSGSNDYTSSNAFTVWASNASGYVAVSAKGTMLSSTTSILDGSWHYVSVQAGGDLVSGGMAIKVDGTVVASRAALATTTGIPLYYAVGMALDATQKFNGTIDDLVGLNDPMDSASGGTSETMFSGAAVTSALQLQYKMDEVASPALDTSGNSRNLTVNTVTSVSGEHGNALTSGPTQLPLGTFWAQSAINLPSSPRFTIMMWMNFQDTQVWSSATGVFEIIGASSGIRFEMFAETTGSQVKLMPRLYAADGSTQNYSPTTGSIVFAEPNTWHHVAFTIAPSLIKPYIDGVSGASGTISPVMTTFADWSKLNFASSRFASIPNVAIDDVRIISNYLYPDAISRHMSSADASPVVNSVTATSAVSTQKVVAAVSGSQFVAGTSDTTTPLATASDSGTVAQNATGYIGIPTPTLTQFSGTGAQFITGTAATKTPLATTSSSSTVSITGTSNSAVPIMQVHAVDTSNGTFGTSDVTTPKVVSSASGTVVITGTSVVSTPLAQVFQGYLSVVPGTSDTSTPIATSSTSGQVIVLGTSDTTTPIATLSAPGILRITDLGTALRMPSLAAAAAAGNIVVLASSSARMPLDKVSVTGTFLRPGSGYFIQVGGQLYLFSIGGQVYGIRN